MTAEAIDFYASPGPMTRLPNWVVVADLPTDRPALRRLVQGLLIHRDWAPAYGVEAEAIRIDEQQLRTTAEVLERAREISADPLDVARRPLERVLCICRHYALVHVAFLRTQGVAARVRCGFSNYFDPAKWYDHWITEWWDVDRWVREDPQIDDLQASIVGLDFDPYDQPSGKFLTGAEAWTAARSGAVDPDVFGIFDMWGLGFIAGNVVTDFACLNKIELLPWDDAWDMFGAPQDPVAPEVAGFLDGVASVATSNDLDAIRDSFRDDRLRVRSDITSYIDGEPVPVRLDL